ncbi:MAG TPA: TatD family hydrolase [Clostridiaceae bacterium]|jgi:TatD DNase family protein|nr:TatD family hydrolase [Clostridiaceae bacterium]HJJ14006.1 TatD family hydrolase [Clostridiaceae bacterium]
MKIEYFDSHAHYDDSKFDEDRKEIIQKMYDEGVTKIISAGYNLESSKYASKLTSEYDFIYTTCGISPNDIPEGEKEFYKELIEIKELTKNEKCVAIGEIGLDYYWNKENKEYQKRAFIEQINLANEVDLPIVIHSRDAISDTLEILKNNKVNRKGVFHCCMLNRELVKEALKLGFYISFAGPVTFKNSKNAQEIIKMVPNERFFIETDSPYLSPEPNRGKRNDSRNLKYIVEKIAKEKDIDIEKVAEISYKNAVEFFRIK